MWHFTQNASAGSTNLCGLCALNNTTPGLDAKLGAVHRIAGNTWLDQSLEGVVAPWCNPLTLQPEQSGGVGLYPGRAPPLERHDKGSRTRLGLLYCCDPSAWR